MVAAISSFTASSLAPVNGMKVANVAQQASLQNANTTAPPTDTPPPKKQEINLQVKTTEKTLVQNGREEEQHIKSFELSQASSEKANSIVLSNTFRILGSAPDFQVHSTGNSVYLTHSSGYIISLAASQERENIQFNDSASKMDKIFRSEEETLQNNPRVVSENNYTRSGGVERLSVPKGLLQHIEV